MPQRVLVIDDSTQIHRLIEAWLRHESLELIFAANPAEGHATALADRPDLILLDVEMPGINGLELCRMFKSDEALCHVPVIFLTGANSPSDRVAGLNLGAVDYIVKPFHPAEFQARVRAALRTKYLLDLLAQRAQIDGLTGLRNRNFLDQQLAIELAKMRRHPGALACVMCDVDHFKAINDNFGHATGDEALRHVAEVLQSSCRGEDVVARYGGEEFTILTPGVDGAGAAVLAERIRAAVEQHAFRRGGQQVNITCSFGVADYDPSAPACLLEHADAALYAAKFAGRNRLVRYEPGMLRSKRTAAA